MIGSIASLPLPDGAGETSNSPLYADPLQDEVLEKSGIEVYNRDGDYEALGRALRALLA